MHVCTKMQGNLLSISISGLKVITSLHACVEGVSVPRRQVTTAGHVCVCVCICVHTDLLRLRSPGQESGHILRHLACVGLSAILVLNTSIVDRGRHLNLAASCFWCVTEYVVSETMVGITD
jgi:hypothetical protein